MVWVNAARIHVPSRDDKFDLALLAAIPGVHERELARVHGQDQQVGGLRGFRIGRVAALGGGDALCALGAKDAGIADLGVEVRLAADLLQLASLGEDVELDKVFLRLGQR